MDYIQQITNKCTCFQNVVRTNKCKHIAMVTCVSITLLLFVLIGRQDDRDAAPGLFTSGRQRLKQDDYGVVESQSSSMFFTDAELEETFPETLRDSYPEDFFKCFPDQILKSLKSREDLKRFTSCGRIVYNRVPKCGSRTILRVMKVLSTQLKYTLISNARYDGLSFFRNITKLVDFGNQFSHLGEPVIYSQHIHFVNFTQLGIPPPLYINVVREPVERVISHFYFRKFGSTNDPVESWTNQTLSECVQSGGACLPIHQVLPFFCGQTKNCRVSSHATLQRAKRTMRSAYLVVGVTEDIPAFLDILERLLPDFFTNAKQVFQDMESSLRKETQTVQKPHVDESTRQAIKDQLSMEYDFYRYAKQRFYTIYDKVRLLSDNARRRRGSRTSQVKDPYDERKQQRLARKRERNRSKKQNYV